MSARRDPESLTDKATSRLRDSIVDLTLEPGTHLDERVLMRRVGISRTPAREALNRLVTERLVQLRVNRGFFVRPIDIDDTARFFDAYFMSERAAGYFCRFSAPGLVADMTALQREHTAATRSSRFLELTRLNARFHLRIVEAAGNRYLIDFATQIHTVAQRLGYFIYMNESEDPSSHAAHQRAIVREHNAIIAAIRRGDRDTLIADLTNHARRFQARIVRFLSPGRGPGFPIGAS